MYFFYITFWTKHLFKCPNNQSFPTIWYSCCEGLPLPSGYISAYIGSSSRANGETKQLQIVLMEMPSMLAKSMDVWPSQQQHQLFGGRICHISCGSNSSLWVIELSKMNFPSKECILTHALWKNIFQLEQRSPAPGPQTGTNLWPIENRIAQVTGEHAKLHLCMWTS